MAVELVIAPEAAKDIDEAYEWYERRRTGLGEEFLSCVVFYEYVPGPRGAVTVYCVFHTSRDPRKWRERLP